MFGAGREIGGRDLTVTNWNPVEGSQKRLLHMAPYRLLAWISLGVKHAVINEPPSLAKKTVQLSTVATVSATYHFYHR